MFNEFVLVPAEGGLHTTRNLERPSTAARELIVHPVYPNPFRLDNATALPAGLRVQYDLPESAAVSVAVHNMAGQRVRLIAATLNTEGRHFLSWEGLSDMGRAVSSGLYVVKVEAAGESGRMYQATQKVTVVR